MAAAITRALYRSLAARFFWRGPGSALLHRLRAAAPRLGDPAAQAQRRLACPGLYQPRSSFLMRTIARVFCWLGAALGLSLAILLGAFWPAADPSRASVV